MDFFSYPIIDVKATSLRLKALREERNISVRSVQEIFSLEYPQAIYNWENPENKILPRLDNLVVLAKLYEVSIDDLIVIKIMRDDSLAVCEPRSPFGVLKETIAFIKQNASKNVREALGYYFECDLW